MHILDSKAKSVGHGEMEKSEMKGLRTKTSSPGNCLAVCESKNLPTAPTIVWLAGVPAATLESSRSVPTGELPSSPCGTTAKTWSSVRRRDKGWLCPNLAERALA